MDLVSAHVSSHGARRPRAAAPGGDGPRALEAGECGK